MNCPHSVLLFFTLLQPKTVKDALFQPKSLLIWFVHWSYFLFFLVNWIFILDIIVCDIYWKLFVIFNCLCNLIKVQREKDGLHLSLTNKAIYSWSFVPKRESIGILICIGIETWRQYLLVSIINLLGVF